METISPSRTEKSIPSTGAISWPPERKTLRSACVRRISALARAWCGNSSASATPAAALAYRCICCYLSHVRCRTSAPVCPCFPATYCQIDLKETHFLSQLCPAIALPLRVTCNDSPADIGSLQHSNMARRKNRKPLDAIPLEAPHRGSLHSNRRISTGRMRAAERAGTSVAPMLIAKAAAAIHTESNPLA